MSFAILSLKYDSYLICKVFATFAPYRSPSGHFLCEGPRSHTPYAFSYNYKTVESTSPVNQYLLIWKRALPTPTDIPLSTYQVSNAQYSQSEIILTQAFKASHWNCLVMYLSTICLIDKLTYLFPFLILFSTFFSPFSLFLVACTRLYKSLSVGPSVRLSVGPSIHPSVRHTVGFSMFY